MSSKIKQSQYLLELRITKIHMSSKMNQIPNHILPRLIIFRTLMKSKIFLKLSQYFLELEIMMNHMHSKMILNQ